MHFTPRQSNKSLIASDIADGWLRVFSKSCLEVWSLIYRLAAGRIGWETATIGLPITLLRFIIYWSREKDTVPAACILIDQV